MSITSVSRYNCITIYPNTVISVSVNRDDMSTFEHFNKSS